MRKKQIEREIQAIKNWLSDPPCPCCNPDLDVVERKLKRLRELQSMRIKDRLSTKMMEAQQMRDDDEYFTVVDVFSRKLIDSEEDLDPDLKDILNETLENLYEEI